MVYLKYMTYCIKNKKKITKKEKEKKKMKNLKIRQKGKEK